MMIRKAIAILLIAYFTPFVSSTIADDTDIYLGSVTGSSGPGNNPKVFFVLDTSGSMSNKDGGTSSRLQRMKDALTTILNNTHNVDVGLMRFHNMEGGPIAFPVADIDSDGSIFNTSTGDLSLDTSVQASSDDAEENNLTGAVILTDPKLDIVEFAPTSAFATAVPLSIPILASNDDAEQRGATVETDHGDGNLDMVQDPGGGSVLIGLRFQGIAIPQNTAIMNAWIEFTSDFASNDVANTDLIIRGHKTDNAGAFVDGATNDISSRTPTAASVDWSNVDSVTSNAIFHSPNLRTIVQELVDQPTWTGLPTGMAFIIDGSGRRRVWEFDGDPTKAAILHILYADGVATRVEASIGNDADDATENNNNGNVQNDRSRIHLGENNNGNATTAGFIFRGLNIPTNATILYSDVEFEVTRQRTGNLDLTIKAENTATPAAFQENDNDISGRSTITAPPSAIVSWTGDPDPAFGVPRPAANQRLLTPDISGIVQEVKDLPSWASGSDMSFIITRTSNGDRRPVVSHDNDPNRAAKLRVWYSLPAPPPAPAVNQTVGIRFNNVNIPQNANIITAVIEFQAAEGSSDVIPPPGITIVGQASDSASPFTAAANDISNTTARPETAAAVPGWIPPPWTTPGEIHQTDDVTAIVDEITSRTGWCGGNAMVFKFTGATGRRIAHSFDSNEVQAPKLRVTYNTPVAGCAKRTLSARIGADNDDAEEASSGNVSVGGNDLGLGLIGNNGNQLVGLRFANMDIPSGATILNAKITFNARASDSNAISLQIHAEDSPNAASYSSNTDNISSRTTIATPVAWTPVEAWTNGSTHDTPELKTLVQAIVDNLSWASGNAMGFVISATSATGDRHAVSRDESTANAPLLTVEFRTNIGGPVTVRQKLIETFTPWDHDGWTPIVESIFEGASYLRGDAVYYGKTRGAGPTYEDGSLGTHDEISPQLDNAAIARPSHPASYAEALTYTPSPACLEYENDTNTCKTQRITSTANYISPIKACPVNHLVVLTDGIANNMGDCGQGATVNGVRVYDCTGDPNDGIAFNGNDGNLIRSKILGLPNFPHSTCQTLPVVTATGTRQQIINSEECGLELIDYLHTVDQSPEPGVNTVTTHTIGFNLTGGSGTLAKNWLETMADKGGGQFYEATSSNSLVTVFDTILDIAEDHNVSFVAPALSVNAFNRLFNNNFVYFSLFKPNNKVRWNGNIKKFKLCDQALGCVDGANTVPFGEVLDKFNKAAVNTDPTSVDFGTIKPTAVGLWSDATDDGLNVLSGGAGDKLPVYTDRKIFTYTGTYVQTVAIPTEDTTKPTSATYTDLSTAGVGLDPINVASATADTTSALKQALLTAGNCGGLAVPDNTCLNDLILWNLGKIFPTDDVEREDPLSVGNRWGVADPMHSRSLVLTFGEEAPDKPISKLFVGTNDGLFRMINETTDIGKEEWAILPEEMFGDGDGKLEKLKNNPGGPHIYGLDSSPTARIRDVGQDGTIIGGDGDFVHIYIGNRRGGRNLHAYNVTPDNQTIGLTTQAQDDGITPKLLWTIRGGAGGTAGFERLGQTWSNPSPTQISFFNGSIVETKTVLIFGGGYDPAKDSGYASTDGQGDAIFIVDADTGELLLTMGGSYDLPLDDGDPLTKNVPNMNFSIPSAITFVDSVGDSLTDKLYLVDVVGQVWRVDLQSTLANSTAGRLADLSRDVVNQRRKFFYAPEVAQVIDEDFGDNSDPDQPGAYNIVALISGDRANPLLPVSPLTPTEDRAYVVRDYFVGTNDIIDSTSSNYPKCISPCNTPLNDTAQPGGDLLDVTNTLIFSAADNAADPNEPIDFLKQSHGWFIELEGIAEKGFSSATIIDGKLLFTTFTPGDPANIDANACSADPGFSSLFGLDVFTGAPVFANWFGDPSDLTKEDRVRHLGGGPSADVVPAYLKEGVTIVVPTGAGAVAQDPDVDNRLTKTYWFQE